MTANPPRCSPARSVRSEGPERPHAGAGVRVRRYATRRAVGRPRHPCATAKRMRAWRRAGRETPQPASRRARIDACRGVSACGPIAPRRRSSRTGSRKSGRKSPVTTRAVGHARPCEPAFRRLRRVPRRPRRAGPRSRRRDPRPARPRRHAARPTPPLCPQRVALACLPRRRGAHRPRADNLAADRGGDHDRGAGAPRDRARARESGPAPGTRLPSCPCWPGTSSRSRSSRRSPRTRPRASAGLAIPTCTSAPATATRAGPRRRRSTGSW